MNEDTPGSTLPRIQISVPPTNNSEDFDDDSLDDDEEQEFDSPVTTAKSTSSSAFSSSSTSPATIGENGTKKSDPSMLEFPINVECTSLCVSPSGNFVWGGFSDGTIRVFDTSGNFELDNEDDEPMLRSSNGIRKKNKTHLFVASKWCQTFGAVACQIHARGVHTDLLTHVAHAEEDYVFAGVQRGAVEVYAIHVKDLEESTTSLAKRKKKNILDYLKVHVHADAKLKGFGACTKLRDGARPTYLLLTGTGIKNIHIWKFQPPMVPTEEAVWEQLYDTQTNGNTIHLLSFYRDPLSRGGGKLWGVSKSESQKLRLWDLTAEEKSDDKKQQKRAKRPPYKDVENSHAVLGVAGGFCVCGGGPTMYNQLSIVSLDQPKSAYNHTELELPGVETSSRSRRRGNLKQVSNVAVSSRAPHHALLELDDGSLVHYSAADTAVKVVLPETIPEMPADFWRRTICLGSVVHNNAVLVAMSLYNPNTQQGRIVVRPLVKGNKSVPKSKMLESPEATEVMALEGMAAALCTPNPSSRLFDSPKSASTEESVKLQKVRLKQPNMSSKTKHKQTERAMEIESNVVVKTPSPPNVPKKKKKKRKIADEDAIDTNDRKEKVAKDLTQKPSKSTAKMVVDSPISDTSPLSAEKLHPKSGTIVRKDDGTSAWQSTPPGATSRKNDKISDPTPAMQVSPEQKEASPPVLPSNMPGSEDTPPPANDGDITKFLQPKRVLHQWSDQEYQKQQERLMLASASSAARADKNAQNSRQQNAESVTPRAVGALSFLSKKTTVSSSKKSAKVAGPTKLSSGSQRKESQDDKKAHTNNTSEADRKKAKAEKRESGEKKLKEKRDKKLKQKLKLQRLEQATTENVKQGNSDNSAEATMKPTKPKLEPAKGSKNLDDIAAKPTKVKLEVGKEKTVSEDATRKPATKVELVSAKKESMTSDDAIKRSTTKTKLENKGSNDVTTKSATKAKLDAAKKENKPTGDATTKTMAKPKLESGTKGEPSIERRTTGGDGVGKKKRKLVTDGEMVPNLKSSPKTASSTEMLSSAKTERMQVAKKQKPSSGNDQKRQKTGLETQSGTGNGRPSKDKSEADVANILCDLRTSPIAQHESPLSASSFDSASNPRRGARPTREDVLRERVGAYYERVSKQIRETNSDARESLASRFANISALDSHGSIPSQEETRAKLASQHNAAHSMIRKRLLRAAQTTLRLVIENGMSISEARSELKASIHSYQEVVHETLQRQGLEASCLARVQTQEKRGVNVPQVEVAFPFHEVFRMVEEIYDGIEPPRRTPGRPRCNKKVLLLSASR